MEQGRTLLLQTQQAETTLSDCADSMRALMLRLEMLCGTQQNQNIQSLVADSYYPLAAAVAEENSRCYRRTVAAIGTAA